MSEKQFSAGGVIIKKEKDGLKVLLVKDSYGHWTWPKGHIEKGETSEDAALREINEETGLSIGNLRIIEKLGQQKYWFTLNGKKIFKTVDVFLIKAEGDEEVVVQASELQEAMWCAPDKALETIEYEGSREMVQKALDLIRVA